MNPSVSKLRMRRLAFALLAIALLAAFAFLTRFARSGQAAVISLTSQDAELWQDVSAADLNAVAGIRWVTPVSFRGLRVNENSLVAVLNQAPMERSEDAKSRPVVLSVPMPDNRFARFNVEESPIMEAGLAAQFPQIKTYLGRSLDDPTATARFDWTPTGFHAIVFSARGTVYVDPYLRGNTAFYASYFKNDLRKAGWQFSCSVNEATAASPAPAVLSPNVASGQTLRVYRAAVAATGEYTTFHGGTVEMGLAAIITSMNRVNGVYEREVAVRMVLVANNSSIIYTNATTDPYTNNSGSTMLGQNQTNLDSVIGTGNYDIGHVFSTGGGGVASLRSVCVSGSKARGVTGSSQPVGDGFDIDYVAHEMGHQFGGNHTFNGTTGSCGGGNRSSGAAYEPGSGTTIMAYAGICGAENLQPHSDDYFHIKSIEEIVTFISGTGGGCAVPNATGNTPPNIDAGLSYTIPSNTPFVLTASGSDPNGSSLTYCWEQYDLGTASPPNTDNGNRPIFRSFNPTANASRTFPKLSDLINNTSTIGESLPTTTRTMNFRVSARDNSAGGGGLRDASVQITSRADSGPFAITQPNTSLSWQGGSVQTVTWNVANSDLAPVSCANVKISLSTDGGTTYPITILNSTPNDGSEVVTIPNVSTAQARIKIEAVGNIFFDISNVNFTITPGGGTIVHAKRADFDGDGKSDLSVWRGSVGDWLVVNSSNGSQQSLNWGTSAAPYFDAIVPGDYDGDGKTDQAVWRGSDGIWYIRRSSDGQPILDFFGTNQAPYFDKPTQGDYDGDGKTDLAVWRPTDGNWFVKKSSDGGFIIQQLGINGDTPVPGDYDGDGKIDFAVWRGSTGQWLIKLATGGTQSFNWGAGFAPYFDVPVQADYDGDGKTDLAIWRGADEVWYIRKSSDGQPILQLFGTSNAPYFDIPTPGDYDGDGKYDIAVWRPSTGVWFVLKSTDNGYLIQPLGQNGDTPVPAKQP